MKIAKPESELVLGDMLKQLVVWARQLALLLLATLSRVAISRMDYEDAFPVRYATAAAAGPLARQGLDGFKLTPTDALSLVFAKR